MNQSELETEVVTENKVNEVVETMDDYKDALNQSFKKIKEGDILTGTVIGVSDTEVTVDLNYYTEGIIPITELSNDPSFSIKANIQVGDKITATVLQENEETGNLILSTKEATNILAWDKLKEALDSRKRYEVKVSSSVNSGVIVYVEGIRGFIPASHLDTHYVEDVTSYVGRTLTVIVITVDEANQKLVLSAREVLREEEAEQKTNKISHLQIGLVTTGTIEKIAPYGAFVNIGDGLSGLVHISQICGKHIKSPNEIVKEGQEVKVKIIAVKDGKISLSMKAVEENEEIVEDVEEAPFEYTSGEEAGTGLGALLANLKL
ncbi:30S ribosomal protein S1 [Anaerosporobacter faecicola]|uniref:30S ribosomal protein S1 n=1 Tax=Anaerosporobacter faecicola TaxID=2718714 RepID=UPI00143A57CE|nr:S1 RNA-binding domain-containing protein [Anaerosporobacter faecicola]